jgi:hypothetical protein
MKRAMRLRWWLRRPQLRSPLLRPLPLLPLFLRLRQQPLPLRFLVNLLQSKRKAP